MTDLSVVPHSREQKVSSWLMGKGRFSKGREDQRSKVPLNMAFHFIPSCCVLLNNSPDISTKILVHQLLNPCFLLKGVVQRQEQWKSMKMLISDHSCSL